MQNFHTASPSPFERLSQESAHLRRVASQKKQKAAQRSCVFQRLRVARKCNTLLKQSLRFSRDIIQVTIVNRMQLGVDKSGHGGSKANPSIYHALKMHRTVNGVREVATLEGAKPGAPVPTPTIATPENGEVPATN